MDEGNYHNPPEDSEPNGPDEGSNIGELLERTRHERGLSLQQVEQATKIRKRYLSDLEKEDYSSLPDSVYVQGFLKTYANYLGLDGDELARELKRRRGRRREKRQNSVGEIKTSDFERPSLGPGGLSKAQGRRVAPATLLTLIIAVVALGAVISGLYFVGRDTLLTGSPENTPSEQDNPSQGSDAASSDDPEGDSEDGSEGGSTEESPDTASEGEEAGGDDGANEESAAGGFGGGSQGSGEEASVEPGTLAVTISVEGADSWLSVSSDGVIAYEQIARPGFSETFEADEDILLSTGNAGALAVEVNGQDIGPVGDDGEVVLDRSFTLKDAS